MVADVFVLFFLVTPEPNGGIYTIAMLRDRHAERILMRKFFTVWFLFLEVLMQFPSSLLFV